jgi:HPt (histidine-containing phosphotransfer) domain-containing protein
MRWVLPGAQALDAPVRRAPALEGAGLPERLPGLNLVRALGTLESAPLLRKLLVSFRRENLSLLGELRAALDGGDLELARRLIHTVKGVGGNLGTDALCAAALKLEQVLQALQEDGDPALEVALAAFAACLEEVFGSVLLLGEEAAAAELPGAEGEGSQPLQWDLIARHCRRLDGLLEADNLNALGVWDELRPLLPAEAAGRLDPALQVLDFRQASLLLGELVQALEIAL